MKRTLLWTMAAVLVCGTSVFTSCSSDDDPVTPTEKQLPKVSKIYLANTVKAERNVAGNWVTLYDRANERSLLYGFQRTGDRLESIETTNGTWVLTYDNSQHVINAKLNNARFNYAYEYDAQGRLAQTVYTVPFDGIVDIIHTTTYTYSGNKLVKTECTNVFTGETEVSPTATVKEVTSYEWQGDNVVSKTVENDLLNGGHSTEIISYEYTALLNPFYNDILLQTGLLSIGGVGDDSSALSKNLVKTATVGTVVYYYEYTTAGDRVVSFVRDYTAETSTVRATTHGVYEIEYAE